MTTAIYEQKHTALLIVDPYNDFMSEGGKMYAATKPTADSVGFYENMRRLIPAVRAAGIQVFVVPHHRSRPDDFEKWMYVNPIQVQSKATQSFAVDTWGGEWHPEFGPKPGDVVVLETVLRAQISKCNSSNTAFKRSFWSALRQLLRGGDSAFRHGIGFPRHPHQGCNGRLQS
jgi:nicotinamidase-related amidase